MGINGTICFLNHIKGAQSSYSLIEFACNLVHYWPSASGRIVHPDIWVRRYVTRLLETFIAFDSNRICRVFHDELDGTSSYLMAYPSFATLGLQEEMVLDLDICEHARSRILMMEDVDQGLELQRHMQVIATLILCDNQT